jgi:predicted alpha/beta superfamily hydrolase
MFSFNIEVEAQSRDTLHLSLDMNGPISEGWFSPDSEDIGVRGDQPPLSWGTTFLAADDNSDGKYEVRVPFEMTTDSLIVSFKIKVDGTDNPDDGWQAGRNHEVVVYKNQKNEKVLAWGDRPPEPKSSITGQVEIFRDFESDSLVSRDLYIYLPPGYEESEQRYPVLYMHDGQALFDESVIGQEWKVDEAAEELIRSGKIEPIIIVGMSNTQNRIDEYTPTKQVWRHEFERISGSGREGAFVTPESDTVSFAENGESLNVMLPGFDEWQPLIEEAGRKYLQPQAGIYFQFEGKDKLVASKPSMGGKGETYGNFIINKVKPFIDENLRTKPEKEFTALGGSSLGGLITLYLGLEHPDIFSDLLVVSPSVWWNQQYIIKRVNEVQKPTDQRIWLDMGTSEGEGAVESAKSLYQALLKKGWDEDDIRFVIEPGAVHNERAWAKRVPEMLRFLYSQN